MDALSTGPEDPAISSAWNMAGKLFKKVQGASVPHDDSSCSLSLQALTSNQSLFFPNPVVGLCSVPGWIVIHSFLGALLPIITYLNTFLT